MATIPPCEAVSSPAGHKVRATQGVCRVGQDQAVAHPPCCLETGERYSPASWPRGKSGALRVCYVCFERWRAVTLLIVYSKTEMDDIPESMKPALNAAIDDIEAHLDKLFSQREHR